MEPGTCKRGEYDHENHFRTVDFGFVPFFLKGGFFGLKHGKWGWVTALVVHSVYGSILGWLCPVV